MQNTNNIGYFEKMFVFLAWGWCFRHLTSYGILAKKYDSRLGIFVV
jgi:hypothetical protein